MKTVLAALFLSLAMHGAAWAQSEETGLSIRLVADVTAIQPGRPFHAGLFIQHEKGWHTYWKFPGIVGVATGIDWNLPRGFEAGEIEWPAPERVLMYRIKAQGFERDVLLPCTITPPARLKDGGTITLKGKARWMCCGPTCHPGFKDVEIQLPVMSGGQPAHDAQWRPLFEKELRNQPRKSTAWSASATQKDKAIELTLKPANDAARQVNAGDVASIEFFTEDGWVNSDGEQRVKLGADGVVMITLEQSDVYLGNREPVILDGVVSNPAGWERDGDLRALKIAPELQR